MFLPLKFLNVYCKNKKIFFPYIYLAFKIYNEVAMVFLITVVMVSIIIVAMVLLTMVAIVFLVMVA